MKINGRKIAGPNVEIVVIPRENEEDLVFKCQAVLDFSEFERLVPRPKPPMIQKRGEDKQKDFSDAKYRTAIGQYAEQHTNFLMIHSLAATEGLEWERVNPSLPETWKEVSKELSEAGLSQAEIAEIVRTIQAVNGLDSDRYAEAKKRFLAFQTAQREEQTAAQ